MFTWFRRKSSAAAVPSSLPKATSSLASPVEEKTTTPKNKRAILSNEALDNLVVSVLSSVPVSVRSSWYFSKFELPLQPGWDEKRSSELAGGSVMWFSFVLFSRLNDENPFEHFYMDSQDEDELDRFTTLSNYVGLSIHDAVFKNTVAQLSGRRPPKLDMQDFLFRLFNLLFKMREIDDELIHEKVAQYNHTLVPTVMRLIAMGTNKYGRIDTLLADREIVEFWESVPGVDDIQTYSHGDFFDATFSHIVRNYGDIEPNENFPLGGTDFEVWCSERLRAFSIESYLTQPGADQGIDIIADLNTKRIGIQCKRHSRPVGNKAVQEASAGKQFYDLDAVCVISTCGYTKSALDLAKRTNVHLLSEHDFGRFSEIFA
jgi:hypothetical protein